MIGATSRTGHLMNPPLPRAPSLAIRYALATVGHLTLGVAATQALAATDFPNRPIKQLVPNAAGGPTDTFARIAPAGTPQALAERIRNDIASVVTPAFVAKYMAATGEEPVLRTPGDFAAMIRADVHKIGEMARAAELKPE